MPRSLEVLFTFPGRYWLHSSACIPLDMAYLLHDLVAWIKIKPFLSRTASRVFLGLLILTVPYWVLELYGNYTFYNLHRNLPWKRTRLLEGVIRYVTVNLFDPAA